MWDEAHEPSNRTDKESIVSVVSAMEDQTSTMADTRSGKDGSKEDKPRDYIYQLVIIQQLVHKIISYLNGNAAGIALEVSGFLAASTFIIKFFAYCYDRGKVSYWSIDTSVIQVFNNNIILEILFGAIFLLFSLFISATFFILLPRRRPKKFSLWLLSLIFIAILYLFSAFLYIFIFAIDFNYKVLLLPAPNLILAIGIKFLIYASKPNSQSSSHSSYSIFLCVLFLIMVSTTHLIYQNGIDSARSQRTFPLLNDTQVVVYSTSTTYHTARYTIDGDTILIDTSYQGSYARTDGELEYRTFENVTLQD